MKDQNDERIKKMLFSVDEKVDLNLEEQVMLRVDQSVDHSVEIAKINQRIKIGFWTSVVLAVLFGIYSVVKIVEVKNLSWEEMNFTFILMSFYSIVALALLFVQLEYRKRVFRRVQTTVC